MHALVRTTVAASRDLPGVQRRTLAGILLASALLGALPDARAGETTRVSLSPTGAEGDADSWDPSISGNGRFVTFSSVSSNLVTGDGNGVVDIFVRDRKKGQTARASVDSAGAEANDDSDSPAISANGRFVTFRSLAANLVTDDNNGVADIFVHDRKTGQTTRVSVDSAGTEANATSDHPSISANGRFVTYRSLASNLVPDDSNDVHDVFVHDRKTGETACVSVDSAGSQGNGNSGDAWISPSISANGRLVAFRSLASNLVPDDRNGVGDIFVHDRKTGLTARVSLDSAGGQGNASSDGPSISANGRFVAYSSSASNLAPGDDNGTRDIFVHDRKTGLTRRVSVNSAGDQGNANSDNQSISANGRFVAFGSAATNLAPGDDNEQFDIFMHDSKTGLTTRVSEDSLGVGGNDQAWNASMSAKGRFVAFESNSTNLVPDDDNGSWDVFVHDRK